MVYAAKRHFELTPLSEAEQKIVGALDYSESMTAIKNATNDLNELIPDRNADLVEDRFKKLQESVQQLGKFLQVRGLAIDVYRSPDEMQTLVDAAVKHAQEENGPAEANVDAAEPSGAAQ